MQRYETNLAIVPKELAGSTPRKVRISSSGIRVAIGSGLLLFIGVCIAAWATISVVRQMQTRDALRHDGTESIGEVIRKERYIVYYTFIANGSTYSGHARATPRERANLSVGSAIPVRFLSSNPDVNHPANWEWSIFLDLETLMAPLLPGGLGFAFLIVVFRDRRVVAEGTPTVGVVSKCTPTARGIGFDLRYEFRTADGVEAEASGWYRNPQEPGEKICVLYLPQNLRRNQPYPSHYFRVAQ